MDNNNNNNVIIIIYQLQFIIVLERKANRIRQSTTISIDSRNVFGYNTQLSMPRSISTAHLGNGEFLFRESEHD